MFNTKRHQGAACLGMLLLLASIVAADWTEPAPRSWSFPEDHWPKRDYRVEWWYFTGFLSDQEDEDYQFGYQVTFFRIGLVDELPPGPSAWLTKDLVLGHAALTDFREGTHRFSELTYRSVPFLVDWGESEGMPIIRTSAPAGTDGMWSLTWKDGAFELSVTDHREDFTLQLSSEADGEPWFHGPGGVHAKGDSASSLYYTYPRMKTTGTVTTGGRTFPVTGESWMDREIGSDWLGPDDLGWDWFSLRLEDGRSIMILSTRDRKGDHTLTGSIREKSGASRVIPSSALSLKTLGSWESPHTGISYPSSWAIRIPEEEIDIRVSPLFSSQENRSQIEFGVTYWEGAVYVTDGHDERIGRGYVELTGYGEGNRPGF